MKITHIEQTCGACPSQWEITLKNGHMIYVRYRWGCLYIGMSAKPTNNIDYAIYDNSSLTLLDEQVGGEFHGHMTTEQMMEHLTPFLSDGVIEGYLSKERNT